MVCKVKASSIFPDIELTCDFICSVIGKPVMDKGKQVGVISYIDPKTDTMYMDIDDDYRYQFEEDQIIIYGRLRSNGTYRLY